MSMLQVKNLPDDLHAALAARARAEGLTMSQYTIRLLKRDLEKPTMAEWVAQQRHKVGATREIDVVGVLDEVRADLGDELIDHR